MKKVIFTLKGNEHLGEKLCTNPSFIRGDFEQRKFPDGETYLRIHTDVKNLTTVIVCSLNNPDEKIFPVVLFAKTLRELGSADIILVTPYLPYMRQDQRFQPGEALSSRVFAKLLSVNVNRILTVDPHLHRINALKEIFDIPAISIQSAPVIGTYIRNNYPDVVLIGPDSESEQWVKEVSRISGSPYAIMEKERLGDRSVKITANNLDHYKMMQPVVLDDIISSARTMIEIVSYLNENKFMSPLCIGIHAIFSGDAYEELISCSVSEVITCNTIKHFTNKIDVSELILAELETL